MATKSMLPIGQKSDNNFSRIELSFTKLQIIREIVSEVLAEKWIEAREASEVLRGLEELEEELLFSIGSYSFRNLETPRICRYSENVQARIAREFAYKLDKIVSQLKEKFESKNGLTFSEKARIKYIFMKYPQGIGKDEVQKIDYSKCSNCGAYMAADSIHSELQCGDCGMVQPLSGIVFDNLQFYNQEGQKTKSGIFNPNRHFQFWWNHILGLDSDEELDDLVEPEGGAQQHGKVLNKMKKIVARDQKILQLLTVNDIRTMLRELKRTDLNKNVSLILKKLTGVGPPHLSPTIAIQVENLFMKAIEASEKIRRENFCGRGGKRRVNRNYYPYYIYKILDLILPEKDFESRRVLCYIYIQSDETIVVDDQEWEQICKKVPELTYMPTDRTKTLKYFIY